MNYVHVYFSTRRPVTVTYRQFYPWRSNLPTRPSYRKTTRKSQPYERTTPKYQPRRLIDTASTTIAPVYVRKHTTRSSWRDRFTRASRTTTAAPTIRTTTRSPYRRTYEWQKSGLSSRYTTKSPYSWLNRRQPPTTTPPPLRRQPPTTPPPITYKYRSVVTKPPASGFVTEFALPSYLKSAYEFPRSYDDPYRFLTMESQLPAPQTSDSYLREADRSTSDTNIHEWWRFLL